MTRTRWVKWMLLGSRFGCWGGQGGELRPSRRSLIQVRLMWFSTPRISTIITVTGGTITSVAPMAGLEVIFDAPSSMVTLLVRGTIGDGPIARSQLPDRKLLLSFCATLNQAAARGTFTQTVPIGVFAHIGEAVTAGATPHGDCFSPGFTHNEVSRHSVRPARSSAQGRGHPSSRRYHVLRPPLDPIAPGPPTPAGGARHRLDPGMSSGRQDRHHLGRFLVDGNKTTVQVPGGMPLTLVQNGKTLDASMMGQILHFEKK